MKDANNLTINQPTVVTIGTFDGVHVGHQKILKRLIESAKKEELASAVLTFFPHPRMVLQKEMDIKLIQSIEERQEVIQNQGIDFFIVHPFTKEFSRLTAQEYVEQILVKKMKAQKVIIGYDHHFGRNRAADIHDLRKLGKEYGFDVEEISKEDIDDVAVSSTKIRKALEMGHIEKANLYLGRPFSIQGRVVHGNGKGKGFGFPTANLEVKETYKLIPKIGVYIVRSKIKEHYVYGMMNIGFKPTVGSDQQTIETYFINWSESLYGKKLKIEFLSRIRGEKQFESVEKLKEAMQADLEFTQAYLKEHHYEDASF